MLFHIHTFDVTRAFERQWPDLPYLLAFEWGRGGVAVFFVLSGFVIAHSLENKRIDLRGFTQFFVRRSLRLDPPYLVSIALMLGVLAVVSADGDPMPDISAATIAAHVFYLQELLRETPISPIYWTLTYEIQFYLVYALAVGLQQRFASRGASRLGASAVEYVMLGLALPGAAFGTEWSLHGLFTNYWFAFYMGVLAKRACRERRAIAWLLVMAVLTLLSAAGEPEVFNTPAALTAIALMALNLRNLLDIRRAPALLMLLGTISYSLYLTHYPMLRLSLPPADYLASQFGAAGTLVALAFQLALTFVAAYVFWLVVERPSQRFSRRFAVDRNGAAAGLGQRGAQAPPGGGAG
ncbi:acyltransferase [Leptolyngbya sp. 15MV]|nr:acyltransferase [Leptolyngbya sp. 15MV]